MSHVLLCQGNSLHLPLQDASVQCIVTSPPFYGLRDYGVAGQLGLERVADCLAWARGEPPCTPGCYLCQMRRVFAECWRVLRADGTCWVEIGDSYVGSWGNYHPHSPPEKHGQRRKASTRWNRPAYSSQEFLPPTASVQGLVPKNLLGIPHRLALALQADGWIWRSDLIWSKRNSMPESVHDRCTRAHEYLWMFSKAPRYFFDLEAISTPAIHAGTRPGGGGAYTWDGSPGHCKDGLRALGQQPVAPTAHPRSVWHLASEPTAFAHFATMPTALVARCIQAGTPEAGVCGHCRTPYARVVDHTRIRRDALPPQDPRWRPAQYVGVYARVPGRGVDGRHGDAGYCVRQTRGFRPACACQPAASAPSIVLDPFAGASTVPLVARQLGRHGVGIELSRPYLHLSRERLGLTALDAWEHGMPPQPLNLEGLPLFTQEVP